jgi:NAD(P)-dependent dehydrogenase (short-subunit alcohol dehydrogenase family)
VRNEEKAQQAVSEIKAATGNGCVSCELVGVSSYSSMTPRRRQEAPEGIELQFATNVLGYFWMTCEFTGRLRASAPGRVVNVASNSAGDLDLDDLEFERRQYSNTTAYRQSKQAKRMLTVALAERLAPDNVSVNACHPGNVNSKLSNDLGFGCHETPDEGARTPAWLATSPVGQEKTGRCFARMREQKDRFSLDKAAIEELYQICLAYTPLV